MSLLVHGAFNLAVNAVMSFVFALLLVQGAAALFRLGHGRAFLLLLLLPFAKVFWDLAPGIGDDSFFWERLRGARHELGTFRMGLGVEHFRPSFDFRLGSLYRGRWYSLSIADLLDTGLTIKVGPWAPALVVSVFLAVAVVALLLRARQALGFATDARRLRANATLFQTCRVGFRKIPVFVSASYSGPPFAAGLFAPYVLFSAESVRRLTSAQRLAVLEHELAHLAHYDVVVVTGLLWVSDVFWFLPGGAWLVRRIRMVLELNADDRAVRAGIDPRELASALVAVAETLQGTPAAYLAAGRAPSSLAIRASRLLTGEVGERARWADAARTAGLLLVVVSVLGSVFFGNSPALPAPLH